MIINNNKKVVEMDESRMAPGLNKRIVFFSHSIGIEMRIRLYTPKCAQNINSKQYSTQTRYERNRESEKKIPQYKSKHRHKEWQMACCVVNCIRNNKKKTTTTECWFSQSKPTARNAGSFRQLNNNTVWYEELVWVPCAHRLCVCLCVHDVHFVPLFCTRRQRQRGYNRQTHRGQFAICYSTPRTHEIVRSQW